VDLQQGPRPREGLRAPARRAALLKGQPAELAEAVARARALIAAAKRPVALVSSWGSNEELAAFNSVFGTVFTSFVKADHAAQPGEVVADDVLILADKNPNRRAAEALFGAAPVAFPEGTDLVLVWGEGFDFARLPRGAKVIFLNSYLQPENGHADVFLPISVQTERSGHYTNFEGTVSAFRACFPRKSSVADAEALFAALATRERVAA
jgi:NADH-quinone oxidoreductase subunit G